MGPEVVTVGAVPDEVLLLCGRPASAPSAWWTPSLVERTDTEARRLVAGAEDALVEAGVRDPASGELSGVLGEVAEVIAAARVLVLLESEEPDGRVVRRSVVAAPDRALLDRQDPDGFHTLLLAGPDGAAALLADLLAPEGPAAAHVESLAGIRTPDEVAATLRVSERRMTTRIVRSVAGGEPGAHMLTVIAHPDGTVACWARPDATVDVRPLDDDAAVAAALALLGAELGDGGGEVAA